MLTGLQSGRAVAAIMVAIFHANLFLLPKNFYDGNGAGAVFNFGYAGVEFFFVLSGFIMMLVHRQDFGRPERMGLFLYKRVVRIYPIYWMVLTFLVAIYIAAPTRGPDHAREPLSILASYLLWPTEDGPIMAVAWTLQHEMLFYLIFATLLWRVRIGAVLFGAWMVACVAALPFYGQITHPLEFFLKPHNLLFAMGIGTALLYDRVAVGTARLLFWAGLALFLGTGVAETVGEVPFPRGPLPLIYGLGAALMMVGLTRGALPSPRWLTFLGDASYSIYLVHLPAMNILAVFLKRAGIHEVLPPLAMLTLVVTLVTVIGCIVHVMIEKPLMAWFKARAATVQA
ncbi:MAG: acyltransferase [Pseudomonadota bacterium]